MINDIINEILIIQEPTERGLIWIAAAIFFGLLANAIMRK